MQRYVAKRSRIVKNLTLISEQKKLFETVRNHFRVHCTAFLEFMQEVILLLLRSIRIVIRFCCWKWNRENVINKFEQQF